MTAHRGPWRVELSPTAVEALRALPRTDQRAIAGRIDDLAEAGPPPGAPPAEDVHLPAGGHVLRCTVDPEAARLVVVTIVPGEAAAPDSVGRLALRRLRRWMGGNGMDGWREVRLAARSLRRAPAFTAAAVLTLALGIGATTAVFSVANGTLLKPLPYGEPDGIVTVWSRWTGYDRTWVSAEEYVNYLQQSRTLDDLALYFTTSHTFNSPENPELVQSAVVTPNLFEILGVEPSLGRVFSWEEAERETPVIMLGHDVWTRRFGADPGVLGTDVQLSGFTATVVGILPRDFRLPVDLGKTAWAEIFFAGLADEEADRDAPATVPPNGGSHGYFTVGRVRDGVTVAEARTDIEGIAARLRADGVYQEDWNFRPLVFSVKEDVFGDAQRSIAFLLAACAFVLLIACGNVANLILSRSEGRQVEIGIQTALGAGRARIVRQLFVESALLAGAAGLLGVLLAGVGVEWLLSIDPDAVPRAASVEVDGTVVAFAVLVSAAVAVLFGWIPAVRTARRGVAGALREGGRGAGARSNRLQGLLVAAQMAMAVVLFAASGLMMRTFVELVRVDLGFEPERVLTARLTTPSAAYPGLEGVTAFWDELLRRVRETPGVEAAGAARQLPLASQMGDSGFYPVGYDVPEGQMTQAEWQYVTPGYIEAMGIPVVAGRAFDERDGTGEQAAMLVNETAARHFWGDRDPLGSRVHTFGGDTAVVVGIVGDIRHNGLTSEIRPRYYRALHQLEGSGTVRRLTLVAKSRGDAEELIPVLREEVRALDPTLPIARLATLESVVSGATVQTRFALTLLGAFSAIALLLAVTGVYGVVSYAVARRTSEIGVRMALGAAPDRVVGLVLRQGLGMAAAGVAIGTGAALALTRSMESMLYGVEARDPLTFVSVPTLFVMVAALACLVPAVRAARVDPVEALRAE